MSIEHKWRFYPPTGTWFRIPTRDGTEITIEVTWRNGEEADVLINEEKNTITAQELEDLYTQSTHVNLPQRKIRSGYGKDGRLLNPFSNS